MLKYRTKDGDMLDALCHKHYGKREGAAEYVLAHNRHLADYGPQMPAGLLIELPDLPAPTVKLARVKLWD